MARPRRYDWTPLGLDSDPVPGDPETVTAESRRLGQTTEELRTQIALLAKIADDSTLKGKYAGTLRAHAQQLTTDLGKVADRYEAVADATGEWSGDLAGAQATSLTALHQAEGPYQQLQQLQAPQQPPSNASATATAQYSTDKQQYQQAQSSAQAALQAAQRLLGEATGNRDTAGARAASKISGASHDSLKDSWWDQFKQMIASIAGNLKLVATILGYLATACAILAVILTGPLALVFLLVAGGLLLTELGVHTLLAATGNGSWVDVGLDVVALATLGYGGVLDAGAEAVEDSAEEAGSVAVQTGLMGAARGFLDDAAGLKSIAEEFGDEDVADLAEQFKSAATRLAGKSGELAETTIKAVVKEAEESSTPVLKSLVRYGSVGTAKVTAVVTAIAKRLPEDAEVAQALSKVGAIGTRNAATFLSGTTIDALDKSLGFIPAYSDLKDKATAALPAGIGIPVVMAAEAFGPTDFVLHMTELASK